MPGVVPTSGEPEDDIVVDTPYLDDVAKSGISPEPKHADPTRSWAQ